MTYTAADIATKLAPPRPCLTDAAIRVSFRSDPNVTSVQTNFHDRAYAFPAFAAD